MVVDADDCTFRVLGPVQVNAPGRPLVFARRQQLDLLAFLLLHHDHVVSVAQIIDAMWGEAVPRTATTQVKNMLSALRGTLTDAGRALATVERQPAGYRLRIAAGRLDLAVFGALVAEARGGPRPPDTVAALLRRALNLWQGTSALGGVRAAFADAARTHLDEQRNAAREALFDAELASGNHTAIIPELTDAVADNPGRERLLEQLMIALYRSGRATDALAVYRRARRTLADEFALEPGPALRALERQILRGDPTLQPPAQPVEVSATTTSAPGGAAWTEERRERSDQSHEGRPHRRSPGPVRAEASTRVAAQLPPDVRGFAGRSAELATLNRLISGLEEKPTAMLICAIMGTAGVGKTALAVHWAHRISDRFRDGQLYVNLRGFDPTGPAMSPDEAVRGFLDAFAVPPERIPAGLVAQAALYRSIMAGRRMLVVLDNALDTEQVRPLLPGTPGCLVLVTSRNRLTGLVAAEAAYPLTLDVLTEFEAREFLVGRLGPDRVAAEAEAAQDIATHCARLPLALAMVAARAAIHPTFPLAVLAAELSRARGGLGALSTDDVRAAFSWSYQRLSPAAARVFRLLGLHPGPDFAEPAAASLAGCPPAEVRPLLVELTRAHLVADHAPGRFAVHDLLRAYAAELARSVDPDEERHAARRRLLDHYLHTADAAAALFHPHRYRLALVPAGPGVSLAELADREQALAWFTAEHPVLVAAIDRAAEDDAGPHAWQLASVFATYLHRRGHWHDWAATQRTALAAAQRLGDRVGQAHAHSSLGQAWTRLGRYEQAHTHLRRAFDLLGELDDPVGQAYVHLRTSAAYEGEGRDAEALDHARSALELYRAAGHRTGQAQAMNSTGWYLARLGRYAEAIAACEQGAALHRELGDRVGEAHTLDSLGFTHHNLGCYAEAAAYYRQALAVLREAGDPYYEATTLTHLGDTHCAAGDLDLAGDAWRHALAILDGLGHPDAEPVRVKLDELRVLLERA